MPNYVKNIVRMHGISSLPIFGENKNMDFNTIIHMPKELNVTDGSITQNAVQYYLYSSKLGVSEIIKPSVLKLAKSIVMCKYSQERIDALPETCEIDGLELWILGKAYVYNKMKYGHATWYGWCCDNWGTKWNSCETSVIDDDTICFETAWSTPEPVITKLSEMYPGEEIEVTYADEDAGHNCGRYTYKDGILEEAYIPESESDALELYVSCWGDSDYIEIDEFGNYRFVED